MTPSSEATTQRIRHAGPPLGLVATIFVLLFLAGLYPVTMFGGQPYFPGPSESAETIVTFFQTRPTAVLLCAALHFAAAIPLGIFAASVVSRLQFLGVRAAGAWIALFGGFAAAFTMLASSSVLWALGQPGIAQDRTVVQGFYWLDQAFGGSGFSVPFGLLIAGIAIPSAFLKLLPKWIVVSGLMLALCGELSWLNLLVPKALFLVPLTRFPGFAWLIAAGFALPSTVGRVAPDGRARRSGEGRVAVPSEGFQMTTTLAWITTLNAVLFLFGAAQHAGLVLGPFQEPRIVPAAIVEVVCGLALAYAAAALFGHAARARRAAMISNLIALTGVAIGLVALAVGAGPRTASNDQYHRLMLAAIGLSFVLLYRSRSGRAQR